MPGMGTGPGAGNSTIVGAFHDALVRQGALIFLILVLLVVAWNGLRTMQYRRASARGERYPGPRPVTEPEPRARQLLRTGFALLWIVDGLLQLQPGMPLGLASGALQPAATGSPGWVQSLVTFGVNTWSRHPTEAAAAAVWIQLGIGMMLLVAPRGRWSRGAGLVSAGWGLVVWVFGEAFGSVLAPGLTLLFGAPGSALFYVVAGGLLVIPDRAWAGRQLGRAINGTLGVFLLVMAGLQAWPGRGFWQGTVAGQPGTLAGMVRQMAATPQPHLLSSLVASFGAFDEAHGWVVNLLAVVVPAAIGLALVSGRLLRPALIALVVFGVADWVLIEDFGVFGGTGTDPNSMLPLLLLAAVGYVALTRAPALSPAAAPDPLPGPEPETTTVPPDRRPWWERIDPGYAGRLAAAIGAVAIVLIGTAPMVAAAANPHADTILTEAADGAPNVTDGPAPGFHLVDQSGQPVSLADLRGYTVALTFLDPVCTTDCPTIAQEFRMTSQILGPVSGRVRFVAIAANPLYNSVAVVAAFDRQEHLDTLANWLFLTGPRSTLQTVWNDYGVSVAIAPAGSMAAHSDLAYVIDAEGNTRRIISAEPGDGTADNSSFSTLLAAQITQVMHT
jgi:cytochrome oxidase Cu insertion factor (SCO1/SenC/PrrC family)